MGRLERFRRRVGGVSELRARVRGFWRGLELVTRRRIIAAAGLVAAVLMVLLVVAPLAPCWAPGGDRCPPSDDAVSLVPKDVDAYVHVNLDSDTDQAEDAREIAGRLPVLAAEAARLLVLAADREVSYERDVAAWSGGELAVSFDAGVDGVDRTLLIEVANGDGANAFADGYLRKGVTETDLDGITMRTDARGTAAAIVSGFLILGPEDSVRETVEVARNRADSLADEQAYRDTESELPEERLAAAYVSPAFATTALSDSDGGLSSFNTFVNYKATTGVAASLGVEGDAVTVSLRSGQDPDAPESDRDFFTALPAFEPTLAESVGADALAFLDIGSPAESGKALIERAAATAPDLFRGLKRFNKGLSRRAGTDLEEELVPSLDGESALTIEPKDAPETADGGAPTASGAPYLALLASGVDVDSVLDQLAELQGPIAAGVDPGSGQAPVFETSEIDGVEAHSLRISPLVDLTYAGWDDRIVVGTSPEAVASARSGEDRLADSETYETAVDGLGESLSMLLYLNTRSLLDLGERLFLGADPAYATVAPDLRTLEAGALGVASTDSLLSTDLRVVVGEPPEIEDELPPLEVAPGE